MISSSERKPITTALDSALLSQSYQTQTNWYVITGAPCSGKTTLLNYLADIGLKTVPEVAREYYENEMYKGRTLDEIRQDDAELQRIFLRLQVELEGGLRVGEQVFLDRAIPDLITFFRLFGMDPAEVLVESFRIRYAGIFILDRIPVGRAETLGPEDEASANFLNEWIERDYSALGYRVMRVPVMPPEERLSYVLKEINH